MLSTTVRSLVCAVTLLVLSAPAVAQTPIDKRVDITFNTPMTVPGVTLPPGTYQFRVANPFAGRNVVQIFDKDGMRLYSTFLTLPIDLGKRSDEVEVRLLEQRSNAPFAMRAWWYPSERTGFEIVYPRNQAEQLAERVTEPVLTSRATAAALIEANDLVRLSPRGERPALP